MYPGNFGVHSAQEILNAKAQCQHKRDVIAIRFMNQGSSTILFMYVLDNPAKRIDPINTSNLPHKLKMHYLQI